MSQQHIYFSGQLLINKHHSFENISKTTKLWTETSEP